MILDPIMTGSLALGSAALSGALGVALVPKLRSLLVPKPRASFLSDILAFDGVLEDKVTILGKDGTLTQTLFIGGIDPSTKTSSEIEAILNSKQIWLDALSELSVTFKVITLRDAIRQEFPSGAVHENLARIHDVWMAGFQKNYYNRHYIVISHYPKKDKNILSLLKKNTESASLGVLREIVSITTEILHGFNIKVLDNGSENYSPLLSFWAELINGEPCTIGSFRDHLSERLTSSVVNFDNRQGIISYQNGSSPQVSAIVSLRTWGEISSKELLRDIQAIPGKLVILQLCGGFTKLAGETYLEYQRKQAQLLKFNQTINAEFENAKNILGSRQGSLATYQVSVFVYAKDRFGLEEQITEVNKVFRNYGFAPIVETMATEWLWRSQFPGLDHFVRPTHPLSHNLAYLIPLDREPSGLVKCDWGEGPIRLFKTTTGGSYSFQFHISEEKEALAHSLVVAPAGSGKTTLYQHLIGGALRHPNLRAYIFDRFNGTRIFTQAVGGIYVDLSDTEGVPLNPLVCDDTEANRAFLQNFLLMLAGCDDSESHEIVGRAVKILFRIPKEQRVLSHLFESLFDVNSQLRLGLQKWAFDNALARWFNGTRINKEGIKLAFDALDLNSNRLLAFEMTDIQASAESAAAGTHYIMHRIRSVVRENATPHLIFIDETKPMLADPLFAKNVATLFLEHRKLRGSINVCFQDAGAIAASGISAIILEQCPTRFLFPNPSANKKDYEIFDLTEFEWEYIKGINRVSRNLKHSVLVKKLNESVILNSDLTAMGSLLQLYRSGSEPVRLVRELQQQWGLEWVEHYLKAS